METTKEVPGSISDARFEEAARTCASHYRAGGRFVYGYVRGKLLGDPVFRQLVDRAPLDEPVIDLGCGRGQTGMLLSLLFPGMTVKGFDWDESKLTHAREAAQRLGVDAHLRFERGDLREMEYPAARTLLMLDVLHYNPLDVQDDMLRRAAASLLPGGRLFLREVDASGGWRSRATIWQERICCYFGLNRGATLRFRSAASIEVVLRECGLSTRRTSSWGGTPLANVLIEARADASHP